MRRIEIDDKVYAHLEARAKGFEQPNDVLRRLLLGSSQAPGSDAAVTPPMESGRLMEFIQVGVIAPGDKLIHVQRRKGRTFTATVDRYGWIETDLGRYKAPSRALADLVGSEINGWKAWTHEASRKTLDNLRSSAG